MWPVVPRQSQSLASSAGFQTFVAKGLMSLLYTQMISKAENYAVNLRRLIVDAVELHQLSSVNFKLFQSN
jgi:hypothetical protein